MEPELRRRRGETGFETVHQHPLAQQSRFPARGLKSSSNRFVKRGAELYEQAELSQFHEHEKLEQSLNLFTEAAEEGEEDAIGWIGNFLDSVQATLPPSVILPK